MSRSAVTAGTMFPTELQRVCAYAAKLFNSQGDLVQCEDFCLELVRQAPEHPTYAQLLGHVYIRTNRLTEAAKWLALSGSLQPNDPQTLLPLAEAYRSLGFADQAVLLFAAALPIA